MSRSSTALWFSGLMLLGLPLAGGTPLPGASEDFACVRVFTIAGGFDVTEQASDDIPADVQLGTTNQGLGSIIAWFGLNGPFGGLVVDVDVPGVDGSAVWSYWTGSSWRFLPADAVEDSTDGFTNEGVGSLAFSAPTDWASRNLGEACGGSPRYWLRMETGQGYLLPALAGKIGAIT